MLSHKREAREWLIRAVKNCNAKIPVDKVLSKYGYTNCIEDVDELLAI